MMKLFLLRPTEKGLHTNWRPWYDKNFGYVIRARNTTQARTLADNEAADENRGEFMLEVLSEERHPWLNPEYSTCEEILPNEDAEIILTDYRSA